MGMMMMHLKVRPMLPRKVQALGIDQLKVKTIQGITAPKKRFQFTLKTGEEKMLTTKTFKSMHMN